MRTRLKIWLMDRYCDEALPGFVVSIAFIVFRLRSL